jgi:hypothetical protein
MQLFPSSFQFISSWSKYDCLCGLVVRVPGYRSGFDYRRYRIFWETVGLERGLLSLMSTIEELFERKCSGSGLEIREYGRRDPSRWPQMLVLTSPTNGGPSVRIVRSRTQATELVCCFCFLPKYPSQRPVLKHTVSTSRYINSLPFASQVHFQKMHFQSGAQGSLNLRTPPHPGRVYRIVGALSAVNNLQYEIK